MKGSGMRETSTSRGTNSDSEGIVSGVSRIVDMKLKFMVNSSKEELLRLVNCHRVISFGVRHRRSMVTLVKIGDFSKLRYHARCSMVNSPTLHLPFGFVPGICIVNQIRSFGQNFIIHRILRSKFLSLSSIFII